MADEVEFRDVWLKDDASARADAIALGKTLPPPPAGIAVEAWGKDLCVAGYEDGQLVTFSSGEIRYAQRVRHTMAFFRVFVAPSHRRRGLVVPLTYKTHDVMRLHALAHPEMQIGGTMAVVTARGVMDKPVTPADMVLIGYTPQGQEIILRWFDHFKLAPH